MPEDAPEQIQARRIIAACLEAGFAAAGVVAATPSEHGEEFRRWLAQGRHGSMDWLAEHAQERVDPAKCFPRAKSLVMVADQYARRGEADEAAPGRGRIARYARGRDYHGVIKKRLHAICDALRLVHKGEFFRAFVDTVPIFEREFARGAALGWIGKHTLLIHPNIGSYTLLGGIATSLVLAPPAEQESVDDHCGSCTRCIDACPTGAITPYSVDASRCVSYLTIEHRGRVAPEFFAGIGGWLYGCDVCQEVCPHNSPRPTSGRAGSVHAAYKPRMGPLGAAEVLGWGAEDRRRVLSGTAMKRATLEMMKRNALIVLGNEIRRSGDQSPRALIERAAADQAEGELVRGTARDVLAWLDGASSRASTTTPTPGSSHHD